MSIQEINAKYALDGEVDCDDLLVNAVIKNFRVIVSSIKKHSTQVEALCDVSSSQLWLLWELQETPGLKVTELAYRLSIHQSTASNLIEKLVKRLLVIKRRDDADQRIVRLYLTQAGVDTVLKAPSAPRGVLRDALEHLSVSEIMLLQKSLETLLAKIMLKDERDALSSLADI